MTENSPPTTQAPSSDDSHLAIDAPEAAALDETIQVRIRGAPPGATVEFEATTTDPGGVEWHSEATFRADEEGVVDLGAQAPESGTWADADPMGWRWSMAAEEEDRLVTELLDTDAETVTLRARADGVAVDHRLTLETVAEGVTHHDVENEAVAGTVFEPADEGPHPAVLVLHGSGGRPLFATAALLARHGFLAVALRYFGDPDPLSDGVEEVPLPYFDSAANWLLGRDDVAGNQVGLLGRSWGAQAALLVGSSYDWAGAVVSYAGSGVAWNTPSGAPAWVDEDGDAPPYVPGRGKPTLCEGQLDDAGEERVREATIPVEDIEGPILLVSGSEDPVWPARRLSDVAANRLREADFEYEYEHLAYEDAGHFLTPPHLPNRAPVFRGTLRGRARADAEAWPRAIDVLRAGVGAGDAGSETA